jgi:cold shock protein
MAEGTVKFFNAEKGFGFIEQGGGKKDLFVHKSELKSPIAEGDKVEFEVGEGKKGPCATNVRKV